jgi:hypothetical protein
LVPDDRLLFVLLGGALGFPAVIIVGLVPRLLLHAVVVVAALYSPSVVAGLTIGSVPLSILLLAFVGSIAAASFVLPPALGVRTPLRDAWRSASWLSRAVVVVFVGMLLVATASTLLKGELAAGTAVFVAVWFVALSGGFRALSHSAAPPVPEGSFLLRTSLLALAAGLSGAWTMGGSGHVDVTLGVTALSALALAVTSRWPFTRAAALTIMGMSTAALVIFYPRSQSLVGAVVFGGGWMCVVLFMRSIGKLRRRRTLLAVVVFATILALPVFALLYHRGMQMGVAGRVVGWGVDVVGERMTNLMNRPERWEVLLAEIHKDPVRMHFTDFADMLYTKSTTGIQEQASPHNILITLGVFLGIPGMLVATVLVVALIGSLLRAVANSDRATSPVALGAFGIVSGLLARSMLSNALLAWPIEITLFGLAILAAWQVDKASLHTVQQGHSGIQASLPLRSISTIGGANGSNTR